MPPLNLGYPWVDVRAFAPPGTPRDGIQDWSGFIQQAVSYIINGALQQQDVGTLYLPPGIYRLTQPIQITLSVPLQPPGAPPKGPYTFCSVQIVGDGPYIQPPTLAPDYVDKPAIMIQAGESITLKNLYIKGKNIWSSNVPSVTEVILGDDPNDFLVANQSFTVTDNLRYAPYAGICIDPYWDLAAFPSNDYYQALPAYYALGPGSTGISIENCFINGFVVGIMITPHPFNKAVPFANGELIFINNCQIQNTKSAIAIGQTQSRSLSCSNLSVDTSKYVVDCLNYGNGGGNCPSIFNANVSTVRHLFNVFSSGSGASINGLYCEATAGIGTLNGGGASDGYCFNGCAFDLMGSANHPAVNYHFANAARATFNACQFTVLEAVNGSVLPMWIQNSGLVAFRECSFGGGGLMDNQLPFWINDQLGPQRVNFDSSYAMSSPFPALLSRNLGPYNLSASPMFNQFVLPGCIFSPVSDLLAPASVANAPRWVSSSIRSIPIGQMTLTFANPPDGTATFQPPPGIVVVGDFIYSDHSYSNVFDGSPSTVVATVIGKVTQVDPNTGRVTLSYIPRFVIDAGNPNPLPTLSVVGFYKVHNPTKGTVGATNDTINFNPGINATVWMPGDRIRDFTTTAQPLGLIPADTYIKSVVVQGNILTQITLSKPMAQGAVQGNSIMLYDAEVRYFTTTQLVE
jgi:hypothetical protein